MVKKEIALVNKKTVTADYLQERAEKLTDLSEEAELMVNFLDHLSVDAKTNKDMLMAFIASGVLENITDVLQNIQHGIQDVSDDICPDLDND